MRNFEKIMNTPPHLLSYVWQYLITCNAQLWKAYRIKWDLGAVR